MQQVMDLTLYAWVGDDEFGAGRIGLKQALVPAGFIPLVAMDFDRHKIDNPTVRDQLEAQAKQFNKTIRLVELKVQAIIDIVGDDHA